MIERGTPVLINFKTVAQVTALLLIFASPFKSPDFKVDACRHVAPSAAVSDVCKPAHCELVVYDKFQKVLAVV